MERDTDRVLHQKVTRHRKIADKSTRYASETAGELVVGNALLISNSDIGRSDGQAF
jgi:hypothetical protein